MGYLYGLLRVDSSPEAEAHNALWLGPNTLGIEVTRVDLAARCGLGNNDPQHRQDGKGDSSAIEEALRRGWFPPKGARLVTDRCDKDSLGTMAVYDLLAKKLWIDRELVSWVGMMDRVGFENAKKQVSVELLISRRDETDAMQAIVNGNRWPNLEDNVREIGRILSNTMPRGEIAAIAALKNRNRESFRAELHGGIAFVKAPGKYDPARDWANRNYPVVLVCDPEYILEGTAIQVCRWCVVRQESVFDRRGFERLVNEAEAEARGISSDELRARGLAWGGPRNIVSSPKGVNTILSEATIIAIARQCTESGIVS